MECILSTDEILIINKRSGNISKSKNESDDINIGDRFCLNKIIRIDNWEYQNEIIIPKDSYSLIDNYLEEGKKIIGSGVLKNNNCGFNPNF